MRGSDVARDLKNAELKKASSVMSRGTDLLYGVYRLAGLDAAAANLRPARARRRTPAGEQMGEAMMPPASPEMVEAMVIAG